MTKHKDLRVDGRVRQSRSPRATEPVIAEKSPAPSLAEVWPDVAARLGGTLRARGVDRATAEDVAQETALRVLRHRVPFLDADDLFRWASVVAWRLAIDTRRKAAHIEGGPLPDGESSCNVALAVEQRSALEAVARGLRGLSDADRGAILAQPSGEPHGGDRRHAAAAAVRRHRARNRLLAATKGFLGVLGWLVLRRRPGVGRPALAAVAAAPVLIAAFALTPQLDAGAGEARSGSRAVSQGASVTPSPTSLSPAAHATDASAVAVRREPAARTAAGAGPAAALPSMPALPPVHVTVTDPAGGENEVRGRPKGPDDKEVCQNLIGAGPTCVDVPPLPISPLP